ncbi:MAG: PadR family transcriptional regulator, partial [Caldilineaceae bacterium]|nr:PadR family transcriptional regulator [Caldilineaceae bacterium]
MTAILVGTDQYRPISTNIDQYRPISTNIDQYRPITTTMAIKHVLLALLAAEPAYGYELKKRYDETLGELWPLQQAQVYNNLRLLEKAGQIELDARVAQENLPDQKQFRVTASGDSELAAWLAEPISGDRHLKDEFYLKVMALATILQRPSALAELLWQQRARYLQTLRELERTLLATEATGDAVTAALL